MTKDGHTFGGWYEDATFNTPWDFDTDTVTGDTTLYAKWTINTYTITFEPNGGSVTTVSISGITHGSALGENLPTPTSTL